MWNNWKEILNLKLTCKKSMQIKLGVADSLIIYLN